MTNKEKIAEFVKNNPACDAAEIAAGCNLGKTTVYRYLKEIRAEEEVKKAEAVAAPEAEAEKPAAEPDKETKNYSTREQRGYSSKQMSFVYAHCKNKDLFIAKPVLELMYSWADKFDYKETDELMEDLRNAACKAVKCVSLGNFVIAQKKVRYIESVLKKLNAPEAA